MIRESYYLVVYVRRPYIRKPSNERAQRLFEVHQRISGLGEEPILPGRRRSLEAGNKCSSMLGVRRKLADGTVAAAATCG